MFSHTLVVDNIFLFLIVFVSGHWKRWLLSAQNEGLGNSSKAKLRMLPFIHNLAP